MVAFPDVDWLDFSNKFVAGLGLSREQWTTQISNYDNLAALMDGMKRINVILLGLCRDMWQYISMEYFSQTIKQDEIGSSAMPHKVNPIDFENAEGNFGIANALFSHLAEKLPVSRLQRDLSDSTVLRNLGVPLAHTMISFSSLSRGFGKVVSWSPVLFEKQVVVNHTRIAEDLNNNYIVISEGISDSFCHVSHCQPFKPFYGE